jgi:hypothetical protein
MSFTGRSNTGQHGKEGIIAPGDVQWMTAGSGIIHQEMPKGDGKRRMHGFQLWANSPSSEKMMEPRSRGVKQDKIPGIVISGGVRINVICGEVEGTRGPVQDIVIDPQYLDVTILAGSEFIHPTALGHTVFEYVIEGKAYYYQDKTPDAYEVVGENFFDIQRNSLLSSETLVLFDDGEQMVATTENEPARFLLILGKPIGEPVGWYGPVVMNTQDELRTVFEEYRGGMFIKRNNA